MPIYEFECRSCQHVWDELQKISDPDPGQCPSCGAATVLRRMTAAAFRLKGAGWYETDFKKDADNKRNLVDSKTDAPAADTSGSVAPAAESASVAAEKPAAAPPATPAATPSA
jgi:putative FmdB family regulatory protein